MISLVSSLGEQAYEERLDRVQLTQLEEHTEDRKVN